MSALPRVAIAGASGRMGRMLVQAVLGVLLARLLAHKAQILYLVQ